MNGKRQANGKLLRGFAAMSSRMRSTVCSKGGVAAHAKGVAFEWTKEDALKYARLGGLKSQEKRARLKEEKRRAELAARIETEGEQQ